MDHVRKGKWREMMKMTATAKISSKGQVTIPVNVRRALGAEEGDTLIFEIKEDGIEIRLHKQTALPNLFGILQAPQRNLDYNDIRKNARKARNAPYRKE